jgi:hypothetical protein
MEAAPRHWDEDSAIEQRAKQLRLVSFGQPLRDEGTG